MRLRRNAGDWATNGLLKRLTEPHEGQRLFASAFFVEGATMSEKIRFQCPFCDSKLSIGREQAGKNLKCPKCQQSVRVPSVHDTSEKSESIFESEPVTLTEVDDTAKRFVVRFAHNILSKPMTADGILDALRDGKLFPEMLFAEEGSEDWLPMSFIKEPVESPKKQIQPLDVTEMLDEISTAFYPFSKVLIVVGVVIVILAQKAGSDDAFRGAIFGAALVSIGIWGLFFAWFKVHCMRVERLLTTVVEMAAKQHAANGREVDHES